MRRFCSLAKCRQQFILPLMNYRCLLLVLLAPWAQAQTTLSQDSSLSAHYTAEELDRLAVLVRFFDAYVVRQTGENELQQAYQSFNRHQAAAKEIALALPLDTVRTMFAQVSLPVWNSIWQYGSSDTYRPRDSVRLVVPHLDLKLHGKFWQFLLALSKTDEQIRRYTKTIQLAGSLAPSLYGLYFDQFYAYPVDFTRAANRLVAAVHYLTFHVQVMEDILVKG